MFHVEHRETHPKNAKLAIGNKPYCHTKPRETPMFHVEHKPITQYDTIPTMGIDNG